MVKKIRYEDLDEDGAIREIMKKKEFSHLLEDDVWAVWRSFSGVEDFGERIRLSRDLLRKMYTAFVSEKLLNLKDRDYLWFLKKHISTKERLDYYDEVYGRIFDLIYRQRGGGRLGFVVYDFGCGINGFSYEFLKKQGRVFYIGVEAVGQLCDLQNKWFKEKGYDGEVFWKSLFDLDSVENVIAGDLCAKGACSNLKVGFFFKVLDSLEMLKRDYSKEVLRRLGSKLDYCVVSSASRSLVSGKKFRANRKWLRDFIFENFEVLDEFEIGFEKYIVFRNKNN